MTVTGSREALKPCPFCGGKAEFENLVFEAVVRCTECYGTLIRAHEAKIDTGIAAVTAAWNTRASPDPAGVTLTDEAIVGLLRRHFNPDYYRQLTCKRWKDGIDIDYPTFAVEQFVRSIVQSVQPSIVTKPATSGTAAPVCELGGEG